MLVEQYRRVIDCTQQYFRGKRNIALRKKLKNKTPSILCCNCIAGVMYHDLDLQFLSPTINLFMYPDDYIKFLSNLEHYLAVPVIEAPEKGLDGGREYPIGIIDDIQVYFMHYHSFEEARTKWCERCKRITFHLRERLFCK